MAGQALAQAPAAPVARPVYQMKPEARPDEVTIEAGTGWHKIDVLANDVGVPENQDRPPVGLPRDSAGNMPQICGTAKPQGDHLVYEAPARCVGKVDRFFYEVELPNARSGQNETVRGIVVVTVVARALNCESNRFVKIEGGTFDKANAPAGIDDILALVDQTSFTVAPFCMSLETVSAEDFTRGLAGVSASKIQSAAPEMMDKGGGQSGADDGTGISRRMAQLYMEGRAQAGEQMTLPTLEEIVAAAWEQQIKRPDAPATALFLLGLRGNLQWTSSRCDIGDGKYFVVGPYRSGYGRPIAVGKVCHTQERRDRGSFRLVVRQM
jgi:hypothetical protein